MRPALLFLALLLALPALAEEDLIAPAPQPVVIEGPPPPVVIEGEERMATELPAEPISAPKVEAPAPVKTPDSAAGFGPLAEKDGLGADLWSGATFLSVTPLIQENAVALLEGAGGLGAERGLLRRLALTQSAAPIGGGEDAATFYESRIILAAASGDVGHAATMMEKHSSLLSLAGMQRLAAIALMQDAMEWVCKGAEKTPPANAFWQKIAVICALRDTGGKARAQLTLDVMREGKEDDAPFMALAEQAMTKIKHGDTMAGNLPALHVALMAAGNIAPSPATLEALAKNPYPLLLALNAPAEWRARIAVQLAAMHAIGKDKLREVLQGVKLKSEVLTKIRVDPAKNLANTTLVPARLRPAFALQAAAMEDSPRSKAKILSTLIATLSAAQLASPLGALILEAAPAPESPMAEFAAPLARAAMLSNTKNAMAWYQLANKAPALLPLALLRGYIDERELKAEALTLFNASDAPNKSEILSLLNALGISEGGTNMPAAASEAGLDDAINEKRKGEALLRMTMLSPQDAITVALLKIKTLRAFGLEAEARALALAYF